MSQKRTIPLALQADTLRRQGHSFREIGKRLGVAASTVKAWLDRDFAMKRREQRRAGG